MDTRNSATLRRQQGHLNASEMATQLGINRFTFHYWLERGLVPKPQVTFTGKRRYYSVKDVDIIQNILGAKDE